MGTCDAAAGEEVGEAGGGVGDLGDAVIRRGGGDEQGHGEPVGLAGVAVGVGFGEWEVWEDAAVEAGVGGLLGELVWPAHRDHDADGDHGDEPDSELVADGADLLEDDLGGDAFFECFVHGGGDGGAVGDGVGVGEPDLDDARTGGLHRGQELGERVELW